MAQIEQKPTVQVEAVFRLDEPELRALEALAGYGTEAFLKAFYEHMGTSYLKPHEAGVRSLFDAARGQIPSILRRADEARAAFNPKSKTEGGP